MKKINNKILIVLILIAAFMVSFSACNSGVFEIKFIDDGTEYSTKKSSGGAIVDMPTDPIKEGYIFDGWFYDENTWAKPFTAYSLWNIALQGNLHVYAKWKALPQTNFYGGEEFDGLILQLNGDAYSITNYEGQYTSYTIPDSYNGKPITRIDDSAFKNKNLSSITLPSTITSIGAFVLKVVK